MILCASLFIHVLCKRTCVQPQIAPAACGSHAARNVGHPLETKIQAAPLKMAFPLQTDVNWRSRQGHGAMLFHEISSQMAKMTTFACTGFSLINRQWRTRDRNYPNKLKLVSIHRSVKPISNIQSMLSYFKFKTACWAYSRQFAKRPMGIRRALMKRVPRAKQERKY